MTGALALPLAVALLAANAFFVAAEFALVAARRSRIEQLAGEGDRRAGHARAGLRELSVMLAGAQLGITMASLALGAVAEPAVAHSLERLLEPLALPSGVIRGIALAIALAIVVFFHMVIGEMAPKSWAIADPERSVLLLARPFRAFVRLFRPFINLLNASANGIVRLAGLTPQDELAVAHSPSDLLLLVKESADQGTLDSDQGVLLARAVELSGLDAEAVMVPRRDIVALPVDAGIDALEEAASASGRSRLLVCRDGLDNVVGVVHVKDILAVSDADRDAATAGDLARPVLVTPESRSLEDLMLDMRQRRQHLAVVVDEYGTVTGLVALEDLLEELIGEFDDETDRITRRLRRRPDGRVVVPGTLRPDELSQATGIMLPPGPYETVAGFVIHALGRLPGEGDAAPFRGLRFEVTKVDGHRVVEVAVRPQQ